MSNCDLPLASIMFQVSLSSGGFHWRPSALQHVAETKEWADWMSDQLSLLRVS